MAVMLLELLLLLAIEDLEGNEGGAGVDHEKKKKNSGLRGRLE